MVKGNANSTQGVNPGVNLVSTRAKSFTQTKFNELVHMETNVNFKSLSGFF